MEIYLHLARSNVWFIYTDPTCTLSLDYQTARFLLLIKQAVEKRARTVGENITNWWRFKNFPDQCVFVVIWSNNWYQSCYSCYYSCFKFSSSFMIVPRLNGFIIFCFGHFWLFLKLYFLGTIGKGKAKMRGKSHSVAYLTSVPAFCGTWILKQEDSLSG